MARILKITLIKSMISRPEKASPVLRGMGLTRLNRPLSYGYPPSGDDPQGVPFGEGRGEVHEAARSLIPAKNRPQGARNAWGVSGFRLGKTAGRGNKGHKQRPAGRPAPASGRSNALQRRLPKRGSRIFFRQRIAIVNIRDLARFESGSVRSSGSDQGRLVKGEVGRYQTAGKVRSIIPCMSSWTGQRGGPRPRLRPPAERVEVAS